VTLELGAPAPAFALPDPAGRIYTLSDFSAGRALLVVFICNHCPYVIHVLDGLVTFAADYRPGSSRRSRSTPTMSRPTRKTGLN